MYGKQANGVRVDSGATVYLNGNTYESYNTGQNGISNAGTIYVGNTTKETFKFINNYNNNNAIINDGTANIWGFDVTLNGWYNNGIRWYFNVRRNL